MKYSNMIARLLFSCLLLVVTSCVSGDQFYSSEAQVFFVRIVEAKEQVFIYKGESNGGCGINYSANVLSPPRERSEHEKINFSSPFSLLVGKEYLLIIGRDSLQPSLIVDWPKDYEEAW